MRKTTILYYVLVLIIGLSMFALSCSEHKSKQTVNKVIYDTINIAKVHHLENDSTMPYCSMKITYIYPTDSLKSGVMGASQAEMNFIYFQDEKYEFMMPTEAIQEYVIDYINNFTNEITPYIRSSKLKSKPSNYYNYKQSLEGRIVYNRANLLSYQVKTIDSKAGENRVLYQNLVFDLDNGKSIKEKDIFNEDYRIEISKLIQNRLLYMYKKESIEELHQLGFLDLRDISPNENFIVNEDGISYLFNTGTVAHTSLGEIKVDLNYDELANILIKENNPIAILIGKH